MEEFTADRYRRLIYRRVSGQSDGLAVLENEEGAIAIVMAFNGRVFESTLRPDEALRLAENLQASAAELVLTPRAEQLNWRYPGITYSPASTATPPTRRKEPSG